MDDDYDPSARRRSGLLVGPQDAARLPVRLDVIALVIANLGMLAGVLLFGWDLGRVMMTFWAETGVIGFWALLGIARRAGKSALFLVPFFSLHFGGFMLGHFVFLSVFLSSTMLSGADPAASQFAGSAGGLAGLGGFDGFNIFDGFGRTIALVSPLVLLLLFAGHGLTFFTRQRSGIDAALGMGPVYGRVIAMHVALVLGAFVAIALGSPVWFLALLVLVKIAIDVGMIAVTDRAMDRATDQSNVQARPDDVAGVSKAGEDR